MFITFDVFFLYFYMKESSIFVNFVLKCQTMLSQFKHEQTRYKNICHKQQLYNRKHDYKRKGRYNPFKSVKL